MDPFTATFFVTVPAPLSDGTKDALCAQAVEAAQAQGILTDGGGYVLSEDFTGSATVLLVGVDLADVQPEPKPTPVDPTPEDVP